MPPLAHTRPALLFGLLLLLLVPAPARAQKDRPLTTDRAVRIGRLWNGLTYYVRANHEPAARAELRLVVNAGSVLEDDDQRGLAHFVEHMAFNGTEHFARNEVVHYLESVGMRFGPDVNAYTGYDETVYMLTLPTDSADVMAVGLSILRDWAGGVRFDSLQVEKERGVVLEEWRLGRGAEARMRDQQAPVLFGRSRYAARPPIGDPEVLRTFRRDALIRFYREWYRPELMAVVAVGDFDAGEVERMIRARFATLLPTPRARTRALFQVPSQRGTVYSVSTDREATGSTVSVFSKRAVRRSGTEGAYRQYLIETLYHSMLYDRLAELTLRPESPLLSVGSSQGVLVRTRAADVLTATVRQNQVEPGLEALLSESARAARHGFTATELERQKTELLRRWQQVYAEREKTHSSQYAAEYTSHYLYHEPILEPTEHYRLHQKLLPGISLKDVDRYARGAAKEKDRVVLVRVPSSDSAKVPTERTLARVARSVESRRLDPYTDALSTRPLVAHRPEPGRIVGEKALAGGTITEWALSNGARVLIRPTDFKADEVLFAARSPGGTSLAPDSLYIPALTAAGVAQVGGLGELSISELVKRLSGKVAGAGAFIDELSAGLSGAASPSDLETLFEVVYLRFTAPRADTTAFLAYQSRARAELLNRGASPEAAFFDTLQVTLAQNHPRVRPPSSALFDHMDMQRSLDFYRERFADASGFTFYFVGSVDTTRLRPLVERYLASLPSAGRAEGWRDVGVDYPKGVIRKVVHRGSEPKAQTQIVFTGALEYSPEANYALGSLAALLELRLRELMREELGGTYSVAVRASAARDPRPRYRVSIGFGSAPQRVDEMVRAVFAEIDSLKATGGTSADAAKVREMQLRSRETQLRENGFWLSQIMSFDRYGWDVGQIGGLERRADTLTPELLREAARRYLDATNYVQVSLVPEAPAPAAASVPPKIPISKAERTQR